MTVTSLLPRRLLAVATLSVAFAPGTAPAAPAGAAGFDVGMLAYEVNHWPQAYAAFAAAADQGHAESARLALLMWRYGPTLYGQRFPAEERQIERWSRLLQGLMAAGAAADRVAARPNTNAP